MTSIQKVILGSSKYKKLFKDLGKPISKILNTSCLTYTEISAQNNFIQISSKKDLVKDLIECELYEPIKILGNLKKFNNKLLFWSDSNSRYQNDISYEEPIIKILQKHNIKQSLSISLKTSDSVKCFTFSNNEIDNHFAQKVVNNINFINSYINYIDSQLIFIRTDKDIFSVNNGLPFNQMSDIDLDNQNERLDKVKILKELNILEPSFNIVNFDVSEIECIEYFMENSVSRLNVSKSIYDNTILIVKRKLDVHSSSDLYKKIFILREFELI